MHTVNRMNDDERLELVWGSLGYMVQDGKLIPFVGAGASGASLPLAADLARHFAKEWGYPDADVDNLARVSPYVANQDGPIGAKTFAAEFLKERSQISSRDVRETYAGLVALNQEFYITTNYDTYLEDALLGIGRQPVSISLAWNDSERPAYGKPRLDPSIEMPIVYHLHGHWDDPESMVISEEDYLAFLVNMEVNVERDPELMVRLSEYNILYVGYGLRDWDVRVLQAKVSQRRKFFRTSLYWVNRLPMKSCDVGGNRR